MAQREYSNDRPPIRLTEYLERRLDLRSFRRRAVLIYTNGDWQLAGCTIEAFPSIESVPPEVEPRRYPQALLYEDTLTGRECRAVSAELQQGHVAIADIKLRPAQSPQWCSEFLPVKNDYMTRAGHVVSLRFASTSIGNPGPLLVPDQPYYPDTREAARDWLPFAVHHGDRDDRYEQIVFLLPQTRAYITDVSASTDGTLSISLAGSALAEQQFIIKGAYWEGTSIRQLHAPVLEGTAQLEVPEGATRVEYYLIDLDGATYDFQHEDRFGHSGFGWRRSRLAGKLVERVRKACREAEGVQTEFKPFVDPGDKLVHNNRSTKFGQVVTTVVALANCRGGCIFLGIDDDCTIAGVDHELAAWAKSRIDESTIQRYLGTLHNQLKARIDGDVMLELAHVVIEDKLVIVIDVSPAAALVCVQGDTHLYVRTGPNNRRISPKDWAGAVGRDALQALSEP